MKNYSYFKSYPNMETVKVLKGEVNGERNKNIWQPDRKNRLSFEFCIYQIILFYTVSCSNVPKLKFNNSRQI